MATGKKVKKSALTRERILREAVKYADRNGIERLNMRTLAAALDAGVMSMYHHVANKDDLLDAMVDAIAAEISIPDADLPWRQAITEICVSAHQTFVQHAWATAIWSKRSLGASKLAYMESILRVLREGGFSVELACRAYHAISTYTLGFALQEIDFPIKPNEIQTAATGFLENVDDPEDIPYFVEHVRHHLTHSGSGDDFLFMLDMILDGFDRLLNDPVKHT